MNRLISRLQTAYPLMAQIGRFGVVGVIASAIHYSVVVLLVQQHLMVPLAANVVGFLSGFQMSYWGHRRWTFHGTGVLHRVALPKLLSLQLFNFALNESLFYLFLSLHLPYQLALLIVLTILPVFTFVMSKLWVFR